MKRIDNKLSFDTSSAEFFEAKYRELPDPWAFASSEYELNRYDRIYAAIAHRRYTYAFEPGCSVGVLTQRLAAQCEQVEAIDISRTAIERAQKRCADFNNVTITCASLVEALPKYPPDLLILSEIGYYFEFQAFKAKAIVLINQSVRPLTIVAAHWLGVSEDHLLSGDLVHEAIGSIDGLTHQYGERTEGFRLDRWLCL